MFDLAFVRDQMHGKSIGMFQGPKGGSLEPRSPENFCCGARSSIILLTGALILFWLWSPEPKEILRGARSPAFSSLIIGVPRLHRFLITAFLCLFVRVNGRKETESEESTVHTVIQVYTAIQFIMICNNLFRVKTLSVIKKLIVTRRSF